MPLTSVRPSRWARRLLTLGLACVLVLQSVHAIQQRTSLQTLGADGTEAADAPAPAQQMSHPPATNFPKESELPALTKVPAAPAVLPRDLNFETDFPTTPPKPEPSSRPPPVSPSGRWLHSSALIDGKVYIYGGVGSYSTALNNDLWLYNYDEATWTEIQASFVPPFPQPPKRGETLPNDPLEQYRAADAPPAPAMTDEPPTEEVKAANPTEVPNEPIARESAQEPLKIIKLSPIPVSAVKAPGYPSFLETSSTVRVGAHVAARHQELLSMVMKDQLKAETNPPVFWKSNNLSPNTMSPFIAADLWKYDLDTKLWVNVKSESPEVPAPRWLHTAVVINGKMLVFGGVSYSDIILGDLWVFNPPNAAWTKANPLGPVILPREGHTAVGMGNNLLDMVVFGGISYGHVPFNDVWVYKATENQWELLRTQGTAPPPRWLHTASVYVDQAGTQKMFVFGGITRNWIPLDDLWAFDYASRTWSHPKASGYPPYPRMLHGAAMLHEQLFIFQGMANNIPLEDVWVYDLAREAWDEEYQSGAYPFAREGHSVTIIKPEPPTLVPATRPQWTPPRPDPRVDPLMPTIKPVASPRPRNRFRKEFFSNLFVLLFGGAGPNTKAV